MSDQRKPDTPPDVPQEPGEGTSEDAKRRAREAEERAKKRRSEAAKKAWETKRKKAAEQQGAPGGDDDFEIDKKELKEGIRDWLTDSREAIAEEAEALCQEYGRDKRSVEAIRRRCRARSFEIQLIAHGGHAMARRWGGPLALWLWPIVLALGLLVSWWHSHGLRTRLAKLEKAWKKEAAPRDAQGEGGDAAGVAA